MLNIDTQMDLRNVWRKQTLCADNLLTFELATLSNSYWNYVWHLSPVTNVINCNNGKVCSRRISIIGIHNYDQAFNLSWYCRLYTSNIAIWYVSIHEVPS